MRRSAVLSSCSWALLILVLLPLAGCHGGSTPSVPTNVTISPTSLSLNIGGVQGLSASVVDQNGTAVTNAKITFASSDTSIATVSNAGLVCAGTWDANFIVCSPGQVGAAQIAATSIINNVTLTSSIPVFTHVKVDRVELIPSIINCKSQGQTQPMTATAFSSGVDVTSKVGPFTWAASAPSVVTINANGIATASSPGQSNIVASVAGVSSVPASFTTCPVQSISVHLSGSSATTFTLAASGQQQLEADALDTLGNPVTTSLGWFSSQSAVATVSGTGAVTGVLPGTASIVATCSVGCNVGLPPVFGNAVVGTVSGTSATTTAYATGMSTTSLIPIDTSQNTAGTAITLPASPNSFLIDPTGLTGYLGSSAGLMILTTSSNVVTNTGVDAGTVLAISSDSSTVMIAAPNVVYLYNTAGTTQTLAITGATAGGFAADSVRGFVVAGSNLYLFQPSTALVTVTLPATAATFAYNASGGFGYIGGSAAGNVFVAATCSGQLSDIVTTPGPPALLAALVDGSGALAVDSPGIDLIQSSSTLAGCPPKVTDTVTSTNFGQGAFTPLAILMPTSGSTAYVTSNLPELLVYTVSGGTVSTIPLTNGAIPTTGGFTLDGANLYVGGSDNSVHLINTASAADTTQISVGFSPDFVVVMPK